MPLSRWFKRSAPRIDPDSLKREAEESITATHSQQNKVNALEEYLKARQLQNGFGEDFELTFRPRKV